MIGVILAAGEGTRLRPLTADMPKPLVEIYGKPILERCFDTLASVGVDEFVVVVGYMADSIEEKYGGEYDGISVTYAHQHERNGLAHALLQAEPYVVGESFVLMHGDNVFSQKAYEDLRGVVNLDADGALLVEKVSDDEARNSAVALTDTSRVIDVLERPDEPLSSLAVVGFYSLPSSVFDACRRTAPSNRNERELGDALSLLCESHDLRAVHLEGERVNVNEPEDIERARTMLE